MTRARRIAVAFAVVVAAIAVTAPARAEGIEYDSCEGERGSHSLSLWIFVTEDGPNRQWHWFEYELGGSMGRSNNVNIELNQYYVNDGFRRETVYWNHSPDNLMPGIRYRVTPPWPVYTTMENVERAKVTAYFDSPLWFDDECVADVGL
jgi:hypothetical protein